MIYIPLWSDCYSFVYSILLSYNSIYIPLWSDCYYMLMLCGLKPCSDLHSTMVRLLQASRIAIHSLFSHLHSTMVRLLQNRPACILCHSGIYIPLWSDCYFSDQLILLIARSIYIPLWSDCYFKFIKGLFVAISIYIPLWSDCYTI